MAKKKSEGINFFQKYLTIWVFICIVVGVIIGKLLPAIPNALGNLEISGISIPIAILIWIMIYPMMLAVNMAMTKERLINSGFYDLATAYQSVHVNY